MFQTADDAVNGRHETVAIDGLLIVARRDKGGFITYVGYIRARESGRLTGHHFDIHAIVLLDVAQMDIENLYTVLEFGEVDCNLTVEASGTQKGFVKNVGTVGGGEDNHTTVGAETVHLGEELVERIFALVVGTHVGVLATRTAHGVNLVDKHDAGSLLLGLAEEVADTRCTHADKHLDKIGARHREERHVGLAGNSLGKKGLTSSGRAYKQCALGYLAAKVGVTLRVAKKLDNLAYLGLGFGESGNILERNICSLTFLKDLGLGLYRH